MKTFGVPTVIPSNMYKGRDSLRRSHHCIRPCDIYAPHRVETTRVLPSYSPSRDYFLQLKTVFPSPLQTVYKTFSQVEPISQTAEAHSSTEFISLHWQNLPTRISIHRVILEQNQFSSRIYSQAESIPSIYPQTEGGNPRQIIPSGNEGFLFPILSSSSPGFIFLDWETYQQHPIFIHHGVCIHIAYNIISFILRTSSRFISYIMTFHMTNSFPFSGKDQIHEHCYLYDRVDFSKATSDGGLFSAISSERCPSKTFYGSVRSTLRFI